MCDVFVRIPRSTVGRGCCYVPNWEHREGRAGSRTGSEAACRRDEPRRKRFRRIAKMKTRGSWVRVVKFVGVTGLVCGLLLVAAFRGAGKRSPQTGAGLSVGAASQASKISAATDDPKWGEAY